MSGLNFQETTGTADINIKFGAGDHGDGGGNDFDGPGEEEVILKSKRDGSLLKPCTKLWLWPISQICFGRTKIKSRRASRNVRLSYEQPPDDRSADVNSADDSSADDS